LEKNQEGLGPLKPGANVVLPLLLRGPTHAYVNDISIVGTLSQKKIEHRYTVIWNIQTFSILYKHSGCIYINRLYLYKLDFLIDIL